MILRDFGRASRGGFDLIVIGGGAHGVALTLESARRGLCPLLLEKGDFGGETSWNSLRIVHGGLRYLQSLDLRRFRVSVGERSWFLRHFPDQVRPMACLMPLYGRGLHRPTVLRAALALNDSLSFRRNRGLRADSLIPSGSILTQSQTVERFPGVDPKGLQGAALWYDALMPDSQRLLIEMLHWAAALGGSALNYTCAEGLIVKRGRVVAVTARDLVSGVEHEFRAPLVVNCAGPWCRAIASRFDREIPRLFHPSLAFNLLFDRPPLSRSALAVTARAAGSRTYFLVPWKDRLFAGTFHQALPTGQRPNEVDAELQDRFVGELNAAVPGVDLRTDEILRVHWGLIPTQEPGTVNLADDDVIVHHASLGGPQGLVSLSGIKFTTARRVAARILDSVSAQRGAGSREVSDSSRPEPADWTSVAEIERSLGPERLPDLSSAVRLHVELESALCQEDLLFRRTDWAIDPARYRQIAAQLHPHLATMPLRIESRQPRENA